MTSRKYNLAASLAAGAMVLIAGCSSVRVLKVGDGAQPEGIPFYMPRPYVQVFEPFVIGSKAYLVSGRVSDDGKYLLIDNVNDRDKLDGLFLSDLARDAPPRVPVARILPAGAATAFAGSPQGATEPSPAASAPAAAASAASAPASAASEPAAKESQPSGNFNMSVTNTSAVFPPSLGRRFFDVVWMPDFDEKYVVQGTPGLGNANIAVTMTQGWGLYGLDAKIDNSALVKPLLDFYSTGMDALSKLAKSKIFPAGALATGSPQGAAEQPLQLPTGARVTIKVTRVQVVAPGLYPILKPKEVVTVTESAPSPRDLVVRHIPQRPYSNIAFNTYEVAVVEAAKPSGDTPMNLQRYFDPTGPDGALNTPAAPSLTTAPGTPFNSDEFTKTVNALLASRKGSGGEIWKLSNLKKDGSKLTGTVTLTGGTNKPTGLTNKVDLEKFVADKSESKFLPGDVSLEVK